MTKRTQPTTARIIFTPHTNVCQVLTNWYGAKRAIFTGSPAQCRRYCNEQGLVAR